MGRAGTGYDGHGSANTAVDTPRQEGDDIPDGDVETFHEDGQWKNRVLGTGGGATSVHATREKAVDAGRALARDRGVEHTVTDPDVSG